MPICEHLCCRFKAGSQSQDLLQSNQWQIISDIPNCNFLYDCIVSWVLVTLQLWDSQLHFFLIHFLSKSIHHSFDRGGCNFWFRRVRPAGRVLLFFERVNLVLTSDKDQISSSDMMSSFRQSHRLDSEWHDITLAHNFRSTFFTE